MLVCSRRIFIICLLVACFSCEKAQEEKPTPEPQVELDLDAIVKRGYLNALVDNNSVSYFIYKGHPMGYEYELLKLLADELKVDLKIKVTSGLERAVEQLNAGEGDIIAFPLAITKPMKNSVAFTYPHFNAYQVLVQRKPTNWRQLTFDQINENLIRNPVALIGKEVHVIAGTSHAMRLENLSEELGGDIIIREDSINSESESLVRKVALGEIDYTVADHTLAHVNASYYPSLDVQTVLSMPQQIAWALRQNSPKLMETINQWLTRIKKGPTFMVIYNRYFKSPRTSLMRMNSDYSSLGGNKLSEYDILIKQGSEKLGWDWRLLASIVYQESRFKVGDESWAGAQGLMQLMPETAKRFGAKDVNDPKENIKAGVNYLKYLDGYWTKRIANAEERMKFILASYNAGLAHILDSRKLAEKYGKDPQVWNDVEFFLLKKTDPKFYKDPLSRAGYCKCEEPVNYVKDILARYEEYKLHIKLPESEADAQVVQNLNAAN
jgi:membrane-bound lytic murein transglycosylase F